LKFFEISFIIISKSNDTRLFIALMPVCSADTGRAATYRKNAFIWRPFIKILAHIRGEKR
jgi:hypothetical protein